MSIVSLVVGAVSFSKYATTTSSSDSARLANMAYTINETGGQGFPPYDAAFAVVFKGTTSIRDPQKVDDETGEDNEDGEEAVDDSFTSKTAWLDPLFYLVCEIRQFTVQNTGECGIDFLLEILEDENNPPGFHWAFIDTALIIHEPEFDEEGNEIVKSDYLIYDELDDNDDILNYPQIINRIGYNCAQTMHLPIGSGMKTFLLVMWIDFYEVSDGGIAGILQEPRRSFYVDPAERSYVYTFKNQAMQVD